MADLGGFVPHGQSFVKQIFIVFPQKPAKTSTPSGLRPLKPVSGARRSSAHTAAHLMRNRGEMHDGIDTFEPFPFKTQI
jgi:hypothetical protein